MPEEIHPDKLTTEGQLRTTCVHFTGTNTVRFVGSDEDGWERIGNRACGAGIEYASLDHEKLPCFMCDGFALKCPSSEFRTERQVELELKLANEAWFARAIERAKERARDAMVVPKYSRRRRQLLACSSARCAASVRSGGRSHRGRE